MSEEAISSDRETSQPTLSLSRGSSEGIGSDYIGGACHISRKDAKSPLCPTTGRLSLTKLSEERRAKRCRFYRNGDQWFPGSIVAVGGERHRTWNSLLEELTRILNHPQHLTAGVRHIFDLDGSKISKLEYLDESGEYVASSTELFKPIDYRKAQLPQWCMHARRKEALHVEKTINVLSPSSSWIFSNRRADLDCNQFFIKPKLITVLRNGIRPRKAARILLNRKTSRSFEQILNNITEVIKLDTGAVRKIYALTGRQILSVKEFFQDDDIFLAYGVERSYQEDFILDCEECKCLQPFVKNSSSPRRPKRMTSPQSYGRSISPMNIFDGASSLPRYPRKNRRHSPRKKLIQSLDQNGHYPYNDSQEVFPLDIEEHYSVGQIIGDGNFAVVRICTSNKTKEDFALKIIYKAKCQGKESMIESEVNILRMVKHPNIVSLYEEFDTREHLYLVMELVRGGDLFDAIASAAKYTEVEASFMLKDLVSALFYLHERNIVHRDVKPENLLVSNEENGRISIKLADFGLAVEVTERLYSVCGTPTYVAPEILSENGYGLKVDIWAAGVITYILLCGFPPFVSASNDEEHLFDQIIRGCYEFHSPYWDHISETAKDLIANMIDVNEDKRYSSSNVLNHPWLTIASTALSNGDPTLDTYSECQRMESVTNNNY